MLTVRDVLAHPALELTLLSSGGPGTEKPLTAEVTWAATTELDDPGRFLAGGEIVLTTGLRQRTAAAQAAFVGSVAAAGAAALGFGTGLTHRQVPEGTRKAAAAHGLALFEVPYSIPFLAIDRYVADRVLAEHYDRPRRLLQAYDRLTSAVLSSEALDGLVESLHRIVRAPVAVLDERGEVLVSAPARSSSTDTWSLDDPDPALQRHRVESAGELVAHLCARAPQDLADVLPYAVGLVGLELSRRRAVLEGQRLLLADVLADIIGGTITEVDAIRRLQRFDIDVTADNAVVLGTSAEASQHQLRRLAAGPVDHPGAVTAWLDSTLVVILRGSLDPERAAARLATHLRGTGAVSVGIGGSHRGIAGLRWSYHEARQAMGRGPGVHAAAGLSMAGLLMASEDVPLAALAVETLRPLVEFDAAHGTSLVDTLRSYLDLDGSVGRVAEVKVLHRNTVRYRLDQITRLSGQGVDSTADRLQWYLALLATDRRR